MTSDLSLSEAREAALTAFADRTTTVEEAAKRVLSTGREYLGLSTGFQTVIEDGTQVIERSVGVTDTLYPGAACPLEEAYCKRTVERDGPLSIHHLDGDGDSEIPQAAVDRFRLRSYIGCSVTVDGDIYGTVCFADTEPRSEPFSESEQLFVELLAQLLGEAFERQSYRESLEALHGVATDVMELDDRTEICRRTVRAAETVLDLDHSLIALECDGTLDPVAHSEALDADQIERPNPDAGVLAEAFRTGETIVVDDASDHERALEYKSFASAITVPVGEFGVFQAVDTDVGAFDTEAVELAELLVSHTVSAIRATARKEELREKNERLAAQNEQLDEFAAVVSHDLQNPITVIDSHVGAMDVPESDQHLVENVDTAVDRMQTILDEVLDLTARHPESPEIGPVSLDAVVRDCWQLVDTRAATLTVETDQTIHANENQLKQAVENLLVNAVTHAGDSVTVTVGDLDGADHDGADGAPEESDGGFYVADDGPGIPPEERENVLEMGYSNRDGGTGLGLGIVTKVAAAHGWTVSVGESECGGVRFEFTGVQSGE